jgi:glycosyltransferase EpsE
MEITRLSVLDLEDGRQPVYNEDGTIAVLQYTVTPRTVRCEDQDLWFKFFKARFTGHNMQDPLYLVREDTNAVRRRSTRARLNSFRTTMGGYSSLGFPLHWYAIPILELLKIFIPVRAFMWYRDWEMRSQVSEASPGDRNA